MIQLWKKNKIITCNDQISPNLCILSKTKRQLEQCDPSYDFFSKEK
jgi:hypothetical protein